MTKHELTIEKLVYGGNGMGRVDGKAVFVPFTAPGDIAQIEIVEGHKGYDVARLVKIIEPSPARCEPRCKYFGVCGGCHYQHINYAEQILWKQMILEEQLARIGSARETQILPTIPSPKIWEYRNRIQLHQKGDKFGYFKMASHDVIEIDSCPIADEEINKKLGGFARVFSMEHCHPRFRGDDKKNTRQVRGLPASPDAKGGWRAGRLEISSAKVGSFAQINSHANKKLKDLIIEWAGELNLKNVIELYAGSGNFTCELAEFAGKIIAVELDGRAVKEGQGISGEMGLHNIEFIKNSAEAFLSRPKIEHHTNLLLADPPREGLGKKVVDGIVKLKPDAILYVSCNPATLARDAKQFIEHGYTFKKCQPIDMFPQTYHIESVSLLQSCYPRA